MAEHKPTVERDANGVPTAWLLVRAGPVPLRKNGADYMLELTSKDLSGIVNYQRTSGERIPIDSNHYLHVLAIDRRAGGKDFYNTCHLTNQIYSLRLAVRLPHTFCSKFLLFVASRGQVPSLIHFKDFTVCRVSRSKEKYIERKRVFRGAKRPSTRMRQKEKDGMSSSFPRSEAIHNATTASIPSYYSFSNRFYSELF